MKTAGIIAEYNPFHNGHKYHIEETRRQAGADYIIAVMSGDFVQRGAPAILDKFTRTKMALLNGADLVIELPAIAALSSAEGFSTGGVCLLDGIGVTDVISFGCEADTSSIRELEKTAGLLANESPEYKQALSIALKKGMSFPNARQHAVDLCLGADHASLLSGPNNILALEYLKAIARTGASLQPVMITRTGNAYHDTALDGCLCSATAIRRTMLECRYGNADASILHESVPHSVFGMLADALQKQQILTEDDFSDLLFYALLEKSGSDHTYHAPYADLFSRMQNQLEHYHSWSEFASLLKTKNRTYTAISRALTYILLNIQKEDFLLAETFSFAPYARVLGFKKSASQLLEKINEKSSIPVITRLASADRILNAKQKKLLDLNIRATALYQHICTSGSLNKDFSEYRRPLIYL